MLWKFNSVYDPQLQLKDHEQPVRYELALPPEPKAIVDRNAMYIHRPNGHVRGVLDPATESFVNETRIGEQPASVDSAANGSL